MNGPYQLAPLTLFSVGMLKTNYSEVVSFSLLLPPCVLLTGQYAPTSSIRARILSPCLPPRLLLYNKYICFVFPLKGKGPKASYNKLGKLFIVQISIRVLKRKWSVGPDKHCVLDSDGEGLRFHLNVHTAPGLWWVCENSALSSRVGSMGWGWWHQLGPTAVGMWALADWDPRLAAYGS